jgi:AcrR family transcriptional regulator
MVLSVKSDSEPGPEDRRATRGTPAGSASDETIERVLDAAEELFYGRGIQSVGMDEVRDQSGVALKRLYQLFSSKEKLVIAVLERRDEHWHQRLSAHVDNVKEPSARILAVYDWLGQWFNEPGFRGCAWINTNGELGAISPAIAEQAKRHKTRFKHYIAQLVADAGLPPQLAEQLALLAEGAMVDAGIFTTFASAAQARAAAQTLIQAARANQRH